MGSSLAGPGVFNRDQPRCREALTRVVDLLGPWVLGVNRYCLTGLDHQ
jgi:hypothetical protein